VKNKSTGISLFNAKMCNVVETYLKNVWMYDQVPGDDLCSSTAPISLDGVKGDTLASVGAES